MKKLITILILLISFNKLMAQNEGRFGIITGMNKTALSNADDVKFGDLYPTFKPTIGVEAGYHFTLFKTLSSGFTLQLANNKLGQNYRGFYSDGSDYYAYRRLNYMRGGLGWSIGSNIRKQFSFALTTGITYGFLTSYQDRYELRRFNNDRLILDITDNDVEFYDTVNLKGKLNNSLFNKVDMTLFFSLGTEFLLNQRFSLGILARMDMGMNPVENTKDNMSINYNTTPTTIKNFYPYNTKVLYRTPVENKIVRGETTNQYMGVYLTLKYRLYNKEKIKFYYKEHRKSNF